MEGQGNGRMKPKAIIEGTAFIGEEPFRYLQESGLTLCIKTRKVTAQGDQARIEG